jgi:hypothetical protein
MIEALANGLLFIALLFGSWVDIRTREVPDWLNYALIAIGVSAGIAISIADMSFLPLIASILGLLVGMGLGYAMYYAGQWGGGDAKLLMGMGSILGIPIFMTITKQPILGLMIWWIIAGAVYGLIWSIGVAIKNRKTFVKEYHEELKKAKRRRFIIQIITAILLIIAIITPWPERAFVVIIGVCVFGLFHLHLFVKCVEKTCMNVRVPVKKLTEGDWLIEPIKNKGKMIVPTRKIGLTIPDLNKLKKQAPNATALIRIGIPFIPVFLLAYLALMIFGSPLALIF